MKLTRWVLAVVVLVFSGAGTGCAKWPRVKPDALGTKTKVAVVSYQSEPVRGFGLPMRIDEVDTAYAAFADALASAGFEVVPTETVNRCSFYHRLPASKIESGTTAKGLARVQLTGREVSGLATCAGADFIVAVYGWPRLDSGLHLKLGQARVEMLTHVLAWDDYGNELWRDRLTTYSGLFPMFAGVSDRPKVSLAGTPALKEATVQSVERMAKLTGRELKPERRAPSATPPPAETPAPSPEPSAPTPPAPAPPAEDKPSEPPLVPAPAPSNTI